MILTTADVAESAAKNFQQSQNNGGDSNGIEEKHQPRNKSIKRSGSLVSNDGANEGMPDLEIVGPVGTKAFLHSLRHFMRRDRFNVHVHEGQFDSSTCGNNTAGNSNPKKKSKRNKSNPSSNDDIGFTVRSIPVDYSVQDTCNESNHFTKQAVSYTFTTHPIPGKFLVEKANALKIPRGPMFAQLKAGKSVTFTDPETNEVRTVTPEEVLAEGSGGICVFVLFCPHIEILNELRRSDVIQSLCNDAKCVNLDAIVHLTPKRIFQTVEYQTWCKNFGDAEHIVLHVAETLKDRVADGVNSPFVSALRGAVKRSLVNNAIFPMPKLMFKGDYVIKCKGNENNHNQLRTIVGSPMLEYVLLPRSRRGVNELTIKQIYTEDDIIAMKDEVSKSGAADLGHKVANAQEDGTAVDNKIQDIGELIFTGTGSALPCKHRNVTGMYLRMHNGNGILLDVGEGTVGQLLQSWKSTLNPTNALINEYHSRIKGIKAAWISHPHADHHLGLLRLLSEKSSLGDKDPIVLMAPPSMFAFLSEYESVIPEIKGSYISVDSRDMKDGFQNNHPIATKLFDDFGITQCISVPVSHCPNAFAIVLDGTSFGRVAYSGDCRPSTRFAAAGRGSDLLIHEATFEDGMEEEAVLKRHSTVGEAMRIAVAMDAKSLVLTHFSQRYPKIPPLNLNERDQALQGLPIVIAFDLMKLHLDSMSLASKLTPALRLLYPNDAEIPDDDAEFEDHIPENESEAKKLMSVPGIFAAKDIL
jgi:ribonuclease Z